MEAGSATLPFFGIQTQVFDKDSRAPLQGPCQGELCIRDSWPGQARSLYRNHERFVEVYFKSYPGHYFTGDGCEIKGKWLSLDYGSSCMLTIIFNDLNFVSFDVPLQDDVLVISGS